MYINPAAVMALFSGLASPLDKRDASLAGAHAARPMHVHHAKRAVTIWKTETVAYTVPGGQAFNAPSATSAAAQANNVAPAPTTFATQAASAVPVAQPAAVAKPADSSTIPITGSSDGPKKVFAHYMMGNSYAMNVASFRGDINMALGAGIDGFALNVGPDAWMADRVNQMYAAAQGTPFKLFISLDMAVMADQSISGLTHWITDFAQHPNQYFYQNKQFVSTFAGESTTFGQGSASDGWSSFKNTLAGMGNPIYFVPSFTALGASGAMGMPSNDGAFSWDAWPTSNNEMSTVSDDAYMSARNGKTYMAGVSPWFYTHFSYKNWVYKSDDLFTTRWEQVVAMQPDFLEIITWNDYGESSYIGPLNADFPYDSTLNSRQWCTGHEHTAWLELSSYYIQAYKNAAYPAITQNKLFWWYRTHSKDATATSDPYGKPTNWESSADNIFLTVMLTGSATVTVTSGGSSQTFTGTAGLNKFQYKNFQTGTPSVQIDMGGRTVLNAQGPQPIVSNPTIYNWNPVAASSSF